MHGKMSSNVVASDYVMRAVTEADLVGTSIITRVEAVAAFARAVRVSALQSLEAEAARRLFRSEWMDLVRVQVSEPLIARAASLAWEYSLRAYDAVQLASALMWSESLQEPMLFATYDRQLWRAGEGVGLEVFPGNLK